MTPFAIADKVWIVIPDGYWIMCPVCRMVLDSHDSCAHVKTKRGKDGEMLIRQSSGETMIVTLMPWRVSARQAAAHEP